MKFCWRRTHKTTYSLNEHRKKVLYLCGNSVRSGGEELGDTSSVESGLWQAKSSPESCSSSSYDHSIKLMIDNWVLSGDLKTIKSEVTVKRPTKSSLHKLILNLSQKAWKGSEYVEFKTTDNRCCNMKTFRLRSLMTPPKPVRCWPTQKSQCNSHHLTLGHFSSCHRWRNESFWSLELQQQGPGRKQNTLYQWKK